MNTPYTEFAYIVFALMGALIPAEQAVTLAETQLAASYPTERVVAAKQTVLDKIAGWEKT